VSHPARILPPLIALLVLCGCSGGGLHVRSYRPHWLPSSEGIAGCCSREIELAVAPDGSIALSSGATGIHLSDRNGVWSRITVAPSGVERLVGITRTGTYIANIRDGNTASVLISRDPRGTWTRARRVNELSDLVEDGHSLFANDGTALVRSDDDGTSWQVVRKPSRLGTRLLHSLVPIAPRTLLALAGDSAVARTDDGGETWQGLSLSPVFDDDLPTRLTAAGGRLFASGANGLFVSEDGGRSWRRSLDVSNAYVIVSGSDLLAATPDSTLFRSSDGGVNWSVEARRPLYRIAVAGDGTFHGYAWSTGFLHTDDARHWAPTMQGEDDCTVDALYAAPGGDLFAGLSRTRARSRLERSSDDGRSWTMVGDSLDEVVTAALVGVRGRLVIGTATEKRDSAFIRISSDGGAHWTMTPVPMRGSITALTQAGDGTIYATISTNPEAGVESGGLLISRDGGSTWEPSTITRPLASIAVISGTVLVGEAWPTDDGHTVGRVFRSSDSGRTFSAVLDGTETNRRSGSDLFVTPDGTVYTCGGNMLHRSTDAGATWTSIRVFPDEKLREAELYEITLDRDGALCLMTGFELYRSTDGGLTWNGPLTVVDDVGGLTGLVTSRDGTLLAGTKRRGIFRFSSPH
jgi:photosystem II stability/assembly factor-like uncharacterized protein